MLAMAKTTDLTHPSCQTLTLVAENNLRLLTHTPGVEVHRKHKKKEVLELECNFNIGSLVNGIGQGSLVSMFA